MSGMRLEKEEQLQLGGDIGRRLGIRTSRDEPLARFSTMRVGGPADLFAEVRNLFELRGIVRFARARDIPLFLIGRGSDLVISDAGIGGLVVLVRATAHRIEGDRLIAEAGVQMARAATQNSRSKGSDLPPKPPPTGGWITRTARGGRSRTRASALWR